GETFLGDDLGLDAKGPSRTDQGVDRLHRLRWRALAKEASKYSFPGPRRRYGRQRPCARLPPCFLGTWKRRWGCARAAKTVACVARKTLHLVEFLSPP